jgi:hypothetical protein
MTKESKGSRLFGDRQIPCDRHAGVPSIKLSSYVPVFSMSG